MLCIPPMLEPRSGHQLIQANGCLYAIGGHSKNIEQFTPELNEWKVVCELEHLSGSLSAVERFDKILIVFDQKLASFDVLTKTFSILSEVPALSKLFLFNNRVFIILEDGSIAEIDRDNKLLTENSLSNIKVTGRYFTVCLCKSNK